MLENPKNEIPKKHIYPLTLIFWTPEKRTLCAFFGISQKIPNNAHLLSHYLDHTGVELQALGHEAPKNSTEGAGLENLAILGKLFIKKRNKKHKFWYMGLKNVLLNCKKAKMIDLGVFRSADGSANFSAP